MAIVLIFQLLIFLFSVIIHEVSHGLVAFRLGDPTAKLAGRLTLNPIKHLDLVGSLVLPLSLYFLSGGSFIFGWAKPVPYNPIFLKDPKKGAGIIAAAGPISNLLVAVVFGVLSRILIASNISVPLLYLTQLFDVIILINIVLAVFNLVPIPPLDGSKVLFAFLPENESTIKAKYFMERYGMVILLIFIFYGFGLLTPAISFLFNLISVR